jgi:Set1/Ash2 histone methyltransferase complex subunit ASH2
MYRMVRPIKVELSSHDRAPQLRLGDDRMTVTGFEGYSVVRATHGVSQGTFYFEVNFYSQPVNSHVRIGWSQSLGVYALFNYCKREKVFWT